MGKMKKMAMWREEWLSRWVEVRNEEEDDLSEWLGWFVEGEGGSMSWWVIFGEGEGRKERKKIEKKKKMVKG